MLRNDVKSVLDFGAGRGAAQQEFRLRFKRQLHGFADVGSEGHRGGCR